MLSLEESNPLTHNEKWFNYLFSLQVQKFKLISAFLQRNYCFGRFWIITFKSMESLRQATPVVN